MSRKVMTALSAVVLLLAQTASADVLWDRSNYDAFGPGFFNVDAGSPPFGLTVHTVNHVSVGGAGWTVQSITTYYSALDPAWGTGIVNGYLHVYDKTGPLPIDGSDDPTASPLVAMSATFNGDHWAVTASGLSLPVGPGEHWIGITPIAGAGPFGPEIHLASLDAPSGDDAASYDVFAFPGPPAWFHFNPGLEGSILIEGVTEDPVSVEARSFGNVKALYR
jgi:hypothetical protein